MNPATLKIHKHQMLSQLSDYIAALDHWQAQGQRYLYIRASRLNPLLDEEQALNLLSSFCRYSRHRFIYILLDQPQMLLKDDSKVLALSRRLGDKIIFKQKTHNLPSAIDLRRARQGCHP